jgi:hypothetical protein
MTDTNEQITTEQVTTTEQVEEDVPNDTYTPPFLRIISTISGAGDRVETLTVELNLRDDEVIGEYDPSSPSDAAAARSWVLDLATTTISEMRRTAQAAMYHFDFRGTSSDRRTGGDRKDAN